MKKKIINSYSYYRKGVFLFLMRLYVFLFISTMFALTPTNVVSQNSVITISENQSLSVDEVFQLIKKQTDYKFFYEKGLFNNLAEIDVEKGVINTNELLQMSLSQGNLVFTVSDNHNVIIRENNDATNGSAQQIQISGKVIDANGQPLAGANILEKGTTNGTLADFDGNFTINIVENKPAIVISYVGFVPQEIAILDKRFLTITLREDASLLDEVIVVAYQSIKKSDLTGSVASVKGADLTKIASSSFEASLAGRVSGVQVMSNEGAPGSGFDITIRGANSISASSSPLYVVDGFPILVEESEVGGSGITSNVVNPLSSINQEDIASIEILKDASATAIYGSRGANGVVLITTKKGKKGALKLNYSGYSGVQILHDNRKIELLNAQQYLDFVQEVEPNSYLFWEDEDQTIPRDNSNPETIDWQDEMYRAALIQNHHVSLEGGKKGSFFNASIGYFDQKGLLQGSDFKRFTSKIAFTHQFNKKLKIQNIMNFAKSENNGLIAANRQNIYSGIVTATLRFRPYLPDLEDIPVDPTINTTSPVNMAEKITKTLSHNNFSNMLQLNYDISSSLKFTTRFMINFQNIASHEFYPPDVAQGTIANGRAFDSSRETRRWVNENLLNYVKKWGDHRINAVAGFTMEKYNLSEISSSVSDFPIYDLGSGKLNSGLVAGIPNSNLIQTSLLSYLGRANYVYKDKYYLTAGVRADGSSKFSEGNKYGYFPSVALAYKISEEEFIKNLDLFDNLKIRTSYGKTGNQSIPAYASLGTLGDVNYSFNGSLVYGVSPSNMENRDLTWETTDQYDAGLDVSMLKGKLNFTTDVYYKRTYDLLLNAPVPFHSGYTNYFSNIGELENRGLEFSIDGIIVKKSNFQWRASYNMSFNRNKIIKLADSDFMDIDVPSDTRVLNEYRIIEGESIGTMWGLEWDGVYQYDHFSNFDGLSSIEDKAALYNSIISNNGTFDLKDGIDYLTGKAETTKPGDIKYRKTNQDGTNEITEDDKTIIGNANPDFFGGITNDFRWKNWDLSMLISFSYGGEVYNGNRFYSDTMDAIYSNYSSRIVNRWRPEKPSQTMHSAKGYTQFVSSSYAVEDASFARLSNITLGYNLPSKTVQKMGVDSWRFTLSADNIYVLSNYSGYDPEVSVSRIGLAPGYDSGAYPRPSVYKFGLKLTF